MRTLRQEGSAAVQLGALLDRQPGGEPPLDAVCLELRGLFLIADQVAADGVELINPPGPLPPACPRLAARLCPQVTIWGDRPVLLLNPAQVLPVAAELGEGIGIVAMPEPEEEPAVAPEPEAAACPADATADEEPEDEFFAEMAKSDDASAETEEQSSAVAVDEELPAATDDEPEEECLALFDGEASSTESEPAGAGTCSADDAPEPPAASASWPKEEVLPAAPEAPPPSEQQKKDSAAIDEETFQRVMAWTVARFKRRRPGEALRLGIEQLPPELAAMVRQKGLSKSVIQYLIDQIVLRCQERTTGGKHAG